MQRLFLTIILSVLPLAIHAAEPTDVQLTKLMAGGWRSPRHDYTYLADGTWYMGRVESGSWHGHWRIKNHHLLSSSVYGDDNAPPAAEDQGLVQTLTRQEIIFGGVYRMKRIKLSQVEL